jgi:hypothetical protein
MIRMMQGGTVGDRRLGGLVSGCESLQVPSGSAAAPLVFAMAGVSPVHWLVSGRAECPLQWTGSSAGTTPGSAGARPQDSSCRGGEAP